MKNQSPMFPICAALSAALLLSSCGKQEAVGDVPSSEELAKQADAATQAIRDQAAAAEGDKVAPAIDSAAMTSYNNALRGFSVLVPKGWALDAAASDDNGNVYRNAESGAEFTVGWTENREDADLKAAVAEVEESGNNMTGSYINENEYRATGSVSEGTQKAIRIYRKPDGTMVSGVITYPTEQAEKLDGVAKQILDSLTLQ